MASRACPPLTTQSRPLHHAGKADTRIGIHYVQEHAGGCLRILVVAVGGRQPVDGQTATVVPGRARLLRTQTQHVGECCTRVGAREWAAQPVLRSAGNAQVKPRHTDSQHVCAHWQRILRP